MAQATPAAPAVTANANATTMDMPRLIQHVASMGYHDIDEVERKGDRLYEVKARDSKGQWVEITVDGRSGESCAASGSMIAAADAARAGPTSRRSGPGPAVITR